MAPDTGAQALIVVPTFNEAENVELLLRRIEKHAAAADVLFVDDSSPDGTGKLIEERRSRRPGKIHLISRPRRLGLGSAYVTGFRWALARRYQAIVEMDADLSHDPADLPRLLRLLETHDAVIGSRNVLGGGTRNWGLLRRSISRFGCVYASLILGARIKDLTGGFNAWRREVLERISIDSVRSEGYAFQIEMKFRAHMAGFSMMETPIVFVDRRAGRSKMSSKIIAEAAIRVWVLSLKRRSMNR